MSVYNSANRQLRPARSAALVTTLVLAASIVFVDVGMLCASRSVQVAALWTYGVNSHDWVEVEVFANLANVDRKTINQLLMLWADDAVHS